MPRVKRGTVRTKKRRAVLVQTKGYKWGNKNLIRRAKETLKKSGTHALRDRRNKKRTARALWQNQLNAAVREHGLSYSKFIHLLKEKNIGLDRKVLAQIAQENPAIFTKIIESINK